MSKGLCKRNLRTLFAMLLIIPTHAWTTTLTPQKAAVLDFEYATYSGTGKERTGLSWYTDYDELAQSSHFSAPQLQELASSINFELKDVFIVEMEYEPCDYAFEPVLFTRSDTTWGRRYDLRMKKFEVSENTCPATDEGGIDFHIFIVDNLDAFPSLWLFSNY